MTIDDVTVSIAIAIKDFNVIISISDSSTCFVSSKKNLFKFIKLSTSVLDVRDKGLCNGIRICFLQSFFGFV